MILTIPEVSFCIEKTNEIVEAFRLYDAFPDDFPRSVDNLLPVCFNKCKREIVIERPRTPVPHGTVLGYCLLTPTQARIYVDPNQNYCWRRFIQAKELFHVVLDLERFRIANLSQQVSDIQAEFPSGNSQHKPNMSSEALAEIAAMEFLFPFKCREKEIQASEPIPNILEIAKKYKVPQYLVEKFLSVSYMEHLRPFA